LKICVVTGFVSFAIKTPISKLTETRVRFLLFGSTAIYPQTFYTSAAFCPLKFFFFCTKLHQDYLIDETLSARHSKDFSPIVNGNYAEIDHYATPRRIEARDGSCTQDARFIDSRGLIRDNRIEIAYYLKKDVVR